MSDIKRAVDGWHQDVAGFQRAHYLAADYFSRKGYSLGIPVIILTTFVGTSVFITLQKEPDLWLKISTGLASVLAATLASLQTFLGYSMRAEKHRLAAAKYAALGRELQVLKSSARTLLEKDVAGVRKHLDDLSENAPHIPAWINREVQSEMKPALHVPRLLLPSMTRERLKSLFLAGYIAFLVAGAAGGAKLMPLLGPYVAAVTVLSFAMTLLILDCVNQLFGQDEAKKFILPGFLALLLTTVSLRFFVQLPTAPIPSVDFKNKYEPAYALILTPPLRMFFAGLIAFLVGQSLNILIFDRIRQKTTFQQRGRRNVGSTLVSQFVDTLVFVPFAFWRSNEIDYKQVTTILIGQFAVKAVFAIIFSYPVFMYLTQIFAGAEAVTEADVPPKASAAPTGTA